ncbi:hypothetical protein RCH10_005627 [Variovorax sp. GrIS 2.14]
MNYFQVVQLFVRTPGGSKFNRRRHPGTYRERFFARISARNPISFMRRWTHLWLTDTPSELRSAAVILR